MSHLGHAILGSCHTRVMSPRSELSGHPTATSVEAAHRPGRVRLRSTSLPWCPLDHAQRHESSRLQHAATRLRHRKSCHHVSFCYVSLARFYNINNNYNNNNSKNSFSNSACIFANFASLLNLLYIRRSSYMCVVSFLPSLSVTTMSF